MSIDGNLIVAQTPENDNSRTGEPLLLCALMDLNTGDFTDRSLKMEFGRDIIRAANMNPAFLLLWIEGNTIHLTASAKEGLIKQHTAERAVAAFKSALARAGGS